MKFAAILTTNNVPSIIDTAAMSIQLLRFLKYQFRKVFHAIARTY